MFNLFRVVFFYFDISHIDSWMVFMFRFGLAIPRFMIGLKFSGHSALIQSELKREPRASRPFNFSRALC